MCQWRVCGRLHSGSPLTASWRSPLTECHFINQTSRQHIQYIIHTDNVLTVSRQKRQTQTHTGIHTYARTHTHIYIHFRHQAGFLPCWPWRRDIIILREQNQYRDCSWPGDVKSVTIVWFIKDYWTPSSMRLFFNYLCHLNVVKRPKIGRKAGHCSLVGVCLVQNLTASTHCISWNNMLYIFDKISRKLLQSLVGNVSFIAGFHINAFSVSSRLPVKGDRWNNYRSNLWIFVTSYMTWSTWDVNVSNY